MDDVVRSKDSCFMKDVTIDGAWVCYGVGGVRFDKFTEAGIEIT